jgi:ribosomal protein L11 methyltransferase
MQNSFIAVDIVLHAAGNEFSEILSALLDNSGFQGIYESENGLIAYIAADKFEPSVLKTISSTLKAMGCAMEWKIESIPEQNWNALWESNYEPVIIGNRCVIRAPFHEPFDYYPIRITIEPKMSFGTGHHHTTRLMIEQMLQLDFKDKRVLDMGCGTGVLGILASMLGAASVCCIDTDTWAVENTSENCIRNNINNIRIIRGGREAIPDVRFDILLANINRNIIIEQLPDYSKVALTDSLLLISGIFQMDEAYIISTANKNGLMYQFSCSLDSWSVIICKRI